MVFITVTSFEKVKEYLDSKRFTSNKVFNLTEKLDDYIGREIDDFLWEGKDFVTGVVYPNDEVHLSERWRSLVKVLPIKAGDVVMQFNVDGDKLLYANHTNLVSAIYGFNGSGTNNFISHAYDDTKNIAFASSFELLDFSAGYVVESDFAKGSLKGSSSFIEGLDGLKTFPNVEKSSVSMSNVFN